MSKYQLAMEKIEWQIEEEEKTIEEMRQKIQVKISREMRVYDTEFILSYAQKMDEAAKKLATLRETKRMLENLAE